MAVLWTTPELASRFAPYIEELHEFFASYGMHYGSAEDMVPLTERLDASGTFAEDLSSMVRAIILRQGGSMPRTDLLEIIAVAIGGPDIDQAAQELQPPVRKLLGFINGVLRRPWNEPPGEDVPTPSRRPIEFPAAKATPAFVRPESVFSRFNRAEFDSEPQQSAESTPAVVADFLPPRVSSPSPEPAPLRVAEPIPSPRSDAAPARAMEPIPTLASFRWPAAGAVRVAEPIPTIDSFRPPQATPVPGAEPIPAVGSSPQPEVTPMPAAEPGTSVASVTAPIRRAWQAAILRLSGFKLAWPPRSNFAWPPRSKFPLPLRAISPPMRSALMAGTGVFLVAVFLILFLHRTSPSPTVSNSLGIPAATANYAPASASVAAPALISTPAPTSKPSPDGPALSPRPRSGRIARSEEIIADPYSTPIPGQNSAPIEQRPSAGRSNAAEPSASDFPGGSTAISTNPAATRPPAAPGDPESTFGGASANPPSGPARDSANQAYGSARDSTERPTTPAYSRSSASRGRYFSVSSGVMARNLVSSPAPSYPMLARLAHIRGQVILQAVVAKDGSVSATHVLRGNRLLRGAAVDAVRRWRFRPYVMEGRPVDVSTIVTVDFDGAH